MLEAAVHVLVHVHCLYGFILLVNMNLPCNATIDEAIIEEFKLSIGYLKITASRFLVRQEVIPYSLRTIYTFQKYIYFATCHSFRDNVVNFQTSALMSSADTLA